MRYTSKFGGNSGLKDRYCIKAKEVSVIDGKLVGEPIDRLAEYEDLEEQGLLLRLPCKVGDTIYVIPSLVNFKLNKLNGYSENNKVYAQKVHSVQMFGNDRYLLNTCEGAQSVLSRFYKVTWFLTREEAEEALEKMKNGTNEI